METATFRLHGQFVDMCNLRAETYADGSRIPSMILGTPAEDASRRDLTINALFYNVNLDTVEDFCGCSLDDLEMGIIRTPCPPLQTFLDDPLRVIRAVRFAGRFHFQLAPGLREAASDPLVKTQLLQKVTRERYGLEIDKMFKSVGSPAASFRLLCSFGLYSAIFALPAVFERDPATPSLPFFPVPLTELSYDELSEASLSIMEAMYDVMVPNWTLFDMNQRRLLLLAAFLAPLHGYRFKADNKKSPGALPSFVLRTSLKLPRAVAEGVMHLLEGAQQFVISSRLWIRLYLEEQALRQAALPAMAGKAVQDPPPCADAGESQVMNVEHPVRPATVPADLQLELGRNLRATGAQWELALLLSDVLVRRFHAFIIPRFLPTSMMRQWLLDSGLVGCWDWSPHYNGRQLMKEFHLTGPSIGHHISQQMDWMLLHPQGSREECAAYLTISMAEATVDSSAELTGLF